MVEKRNRILKSVISIVLVVILTIGLIPTGVFGIRKAEAASRTLKVKVTVRYDYAYKVLSYVNKERKKNGLRALKMDKTLMDAAMQRAAESVVIGGAYSHDEINNSTAHTRPDGSSCFTVSAKSRGENVAYGQKTPFKVMYNNSDDIDPDNEDDMDMSSWMRSTGHRTNILNSSYKSIGVGVVYVNGDYYFYWAQEFGTDKAVSPAKRSGTAVKSFKVNVTTSIYNRLVKRGRLNGTTIKSTGLSKSESDKKAENGNGNNNDNGSGKGNTISGSWVYVNGHWRYKSDGSYIKNSWLKIGTSWYLLDPSGNMVTGWRKVSGDYYYFDGSGVMATSEWVGGYWLDSNGKWTYKNKASWKKSTGGWWYGDNSGWYAKSCWQKIDGKMYYFDGSGYLK